MPWNYIANNYAAEVAGSFSDGASAFEVTDETGTRPTPPFVLTLAETSGAQEVDWEIVRVTDITNDVFTVERAQEGTQARAWDAGTHVSARWTAGLARLYARGRDAFSVVAGDDMPDFIKEQADFVCNGVNDHVEIQEAFDLGRKVVLLGSFVTGLQSASTSLFVPSNISIFGEPGITRLLLASGVEATVLRLFDVENVTLYGFEVDGNKAGTLGEQHAIRLEQVEHFRFSHLYVHDARAHAINCTDEVYRGVIAYSRLTQNGHASNGSGVVIGVDENTDTRHIKMVANFAEFNSLDGLQDKGGRNITYLANTCADNARVGIQRSDEADGGEIASNWCARAGVNGVRLEDTANTNVHDNDIMEADSHGLRLQNNCRGNLIHDNRIARNAQDGFGHGIFVFAGSGATARDNTFHHNRIWDDQETQTQSRAIRQEGGGTLTGNVYEFNDVREGGSHPNLIEITNGDALVRKNVGWPDLESVNFVVTPGTGVKGYLKASSGFRIHRWHIVSGAEGSITFDLEKTTFGDYPSGFTSMIGGGTPPTMSDATKNDSGTANWNTDTVNAGEVLQVEVVSESGTEHVTLELQVERDIAE